MKPETEGKVKYGVWGLIAGAIITMIIGFVWGGWTTASTTKTMSADAVVASQAAICVAQFLQEPNQEELLKQFDEINGYRRADFVEKGGWDKMPGQESGNYSVRNACVDGITAAAIKLAKE